LPEKGTSPRKKEKREAVSIKGGVVFREWFSGKKEVQAAQKNFKWSCITY
jgi:hypothetical protein